MGEVGQEQHSRWTRPMGLPSKAGGASGSERREPTNREQLLDEEESQAPSPALGSDTSQTAPSCCPASSKGWAALRAEERGKI